MVRSKGFTLLELLVVITLMSFLLAVGVMRFSSSGSLAGLRGETSRISDTLAYARNTAISQKKLITFTLLPQGEVSFNRYVVRAWDETSAAFVPITDIYDNFAGVICTASTSSAPDDHIDEVRFDKDGGIILYFDSVKLADHEKDAMIGLADVNRTTANVLQILAHSGIVHDNKP